MARSDINARSWQARKKAMKNGRDNLQLDRKTAIEVIKKVEEEDRKHGSTPGMNRRNPGRMDGVQWNGDSFVCRAHIDDENDWRSVLQDSSREENWEEDYDWSASPEKREHVVSLVDIAKPMKVKGLTKDYEVIASCNRVITWEDYEDFGPDTSGGQWEEWEDLFDNDQKILPRSYAEALAQSTRDDC